MTPDQFLRRCLSIWHVAPAGAWDQIARNGFRTAEQLIGDADLDEPTRAVLLAEPRRESVQVKVDGELVTLRDQAPLFAKKDLAPIMRDGLSTAEWIRLLNRRVYLFTNPIPMKRMLEKYAGQDGAQDLISISPMRLLDEARPRIELAAQNATAIARKAETQKGLETFVSITRFPDRRPAELTVVDGLDASVVVRAERHFADGTREVLQR